MQTAALVGIIVFALWIAVAGVAALVRPAMARGWIARFATSHRVNIVEQAGRGLAGAALIVGAPASLTPGLFSVAGWIVVASSLALLVIPLRWHSAYAVWWSMNLPLPLVRIAGAAAITIAAGLGISALG